MSQESSLTPAMQQYMSVKKQAPPDAVLMFRMGDFYEMFFDDAKRASPILDVVLTARAGAPMCGIPYHALEMYLPKLLDAGIKVAIAEQLEDPALAKKIVQRGITRVITPGTILDGPLLKPAANNFLCAYVRNSDTCYALSWLDLSTGEFTAGEYTSLQQVSDELGKLHPRECIVPESLHASWTAAPETRPDVTGKLLWTPLEDWIFAYDHAFPLLTRHLGTLTLDGFGFRAEQKAPVQAAGAIIYYAVENLKNNASHVRTLTLRKSDNILSIDPNSRRNLELVDPMNGSARNSTLLHVVDRCRTAMGGRLLRNWLLNPLTDPEQIIARQDVVGLLKEDPMTLGELRETAGAVRDVERITAKLNVGNVSPRDMKSLAQSLSMIPALKTLISSYDLPLVLEIDRDLLPLKELTEAIEKTIVDDPPALLNDGGIIRTGCSQELDDLRNAAAGGRKWVAELQAKEQERTGIKSLKVNYNKVFGFYIEITKSHLEHAPDDYVRKQTLVNCERFITPELKEMESRILGADERSKTLEKALFEELRIYAAGFTADLQKTSASLAKLDVLASLADCASQYNYVRPRVNDGDLIDIKGGCHPVLAAAMTDERFIPNDCLLDGDQDRMMIITGPNMAGKSTYIRQTALLVILAQIGSFIPADSAVIGVCDKIFTRVGASDDLSRGQSTFMVEMLETANILNNATDKSLIILDEIGRGTSTFDGLSIAWAVAEYILDQPGKRARTQFATHYHELTELALTRKGVKNYNVAVREYGEKIIFLRQIVPGAADKSYGIHVAKLAGLPEPVIKRAREILENLEENAVGNAGQPSLTLSENRRRKAGMPVVKPAIIQPSLFDPPGKMTEPSGKPGGTAS